VEVVIRPPRREDAAGLVRAAADLAEQYAELEPERFVVPDRAASLVHFDEELARPPRDDVIRLVAEVDGEAVGEAVAELLEPLANATAEPQLDARRRRAYLGYLAVREQFRGQGVGGRLLDAVEALARERGAELISTDTNLRSNVGAVEFYERRGYKRQAVVLRKLLEP
jgi:GNAT superfamily N-acetyltransferase